MSNPDGTKANPLSFATALQWVRPGDTLILTDGIYTLDAALVVGAAGKRGVTIKADTGARPILVGADGFPPRVTLNDNSVLEGIWLGGAKSETDSPLTVAGSNSLIKDCTLWGYAMAVIGGGTGNRYLGNRFINNGVENQSHSLYLSGGSGALAEGNIFVSNIAYSLHQWGEPIGAILRDNFVGAARSCLSVDGTNHYVYNNVFWSSTDAVFKSINPSAFKFHSNLIGSATLAPIYNVDGAEIYNNGFIAPVEPFGLRPTILESFPGEIEAAIAAITTAFTTQTIQQIHDDLTIEASFAVLKAAVDAWKGMV